MQVSIICLLYKNLNLRSNTENYQLSVDSTTCRGVEAHNKNTQVKYRYINFVPNDSCMLE